MLCPVSLGVVTTLTLASRKGSRLAGDAVHVATLRPL